MSTEQGGPEDAEPLIQSLGNTGDSPPGGNGSSSARATTSILPPTEPPSVVEFRVHGVSGTPPESILDDPYPRQVAGDDLGRIFRRRDPIRVKDFPDRTVEAYHWGRYTSGSPTRALWLLLLPFAVVNLARFALLLPSGETDAVKVAAERRLPHRIADALLRLLGLVLTLALVVTACYLAWEVLARQCATQQCAGPSAGMGWFGGRSDGIRVLVSSLAPAAVLALIWWFGRRPALVGPPSSGIGEPWKGNGRIGDPAFWRGAASAPAQRAAHVGASCAVIGLLALATVGEPADVLRQASGWADVRYVVLAGCCVVGAAVALGVVVLDPKPAKIEPDPNCRDTNKVHPFHAVARWAMAAVAAACTLFAWRAIDTTAPRQTGGNALFAGAVNLVGIAAGALLLALFVLTVVMARRKESRQMCRGGTGPGNPLVPAAFRPYWHGMGSWMLASLAVGVGFGFSTATVFWVAGLLGDPVAPAVVLEDPTRTGASIELAAGYWTAASVWGALVAVCAVCSLPMAAWLLRRQPVAVSELVLSAGLLVLVGALTGDGQDVISANAEWFLPAIALLVLAVVLVVLPRGRDDFDTLVSKDYHPTPAETAAASMVVRQWRVAMARYRYHHAIGLVAVFGGLATIAWAVFNSWEFLFGANPLPNSWSGPLDVLTSLGVAAVTAIAVSLMGLGVATWRNPKLRTMVGILWDLVSFWPRVAHPLCPLPYGGRAVLAVARRTTQLANDKLSEDGNGDPVRPFEKVVLSGHSQGAVITTAACAVLYEAAREDPSGVWLEHDEAANALGKTSLVTYGSQLQFIYARLFPAYFGFALQGALFADMLGKRWRSFYRWTDPLGGPVLSWPYLTRKVSAQERYGPSVPLWTTMNCSDGCEGHEQVLVDDRFRGLEYRRWSIGPDIRLRDPGLVADSPLAARLPAARHSGYPGDPGFDMVVAALASEADTLPSGCEQKHLSGGPEVIRGDRRIHSRVTLRRILHRPS